LPAYIPSSYSLDGTIAYEPGQVRLNFVSPNGDNLSLIEQKSTWDSAALLENYVAPKSSDYLTLNSQGLTIYIYNGNQVSWINGGIWYRLEGASKLNREEVLRIIDSL
jgi:hypothetical protein